MTLHPNENEAALSSDNQSLATTSPNVESTYLSHNSNSSVQYQLPYIPSDVPLDSRSFPHQPRGNGTAIPATLDNLRHLLSSYGINPRYNVISKGLTLNIPSLSTLVDTADQVALSFLYSLANLNGIPTGTLPDFISALASQNPYNPVAEWIKSKPWDGNNRLDAFYETLCVPDYFPTSFRDTLLHRWLISAVAAVFQPSGFRTRGVLTLQGPQSIGKTAFIRSLIDDPMLRESTIKLDHHMDASNKDSLLSAIRHWIVEIGELDSSFRKDVARLKGFLTSDIDRVRKPFGRVECDYPRRTVFCATVNDEQFLIDSTGNTRWWTIPVIKVNFNHGLPMQQVFAQVLTDFERGETWWLSKLEEEQLSLLNRNHQQSNAIAEMVQEAIDHERITSDGLPAMSALDVLQHLGIKIPRNVQCKECAATLRDILGQPKRINGKYKWRVPLRSPDQQDFHRVY